MGPRRIDASSRQLAAGRSQRQGDKEKGRQGETGATGETEGEGQKVAGSRQLAELNIECRTWRTQQLNNSRTQQLKRLNGPGNRAVSSRQRAEERRGGGEGKPWGVRSRTSSLTCRMGSGGSFSTDRR